uniref:Uncharacterized protein n=1 Tax=Anopheles farauti TaxID=69004 RepID=A0A182QA21_9DIPT
MVMSLPTGTTQTDVIGKRSGFISSLKPSPTLSLLSSVTNLFYHHRKAFRRKNGTGRATVVVVHGQTTGTTGDALQLDSAVTIVALLHSIIFVVVAFATSQVIAAAQVAFIERSSKLAEAQSNSSIQSTATVDAASNQFVRSGTIMILAKDRNLQLHQKIDQGRWLGFYHLMKV